MTQVARGPSRLPPRVVIVRRPLPHPTVCLADGRIPVVEAGVSISLIPPLARDGHYLLAPEGPHFLRTLALVPKDTGRVDRIPIAEHAGRADSVMGVDVIRRVGPVALR